MKLLLPIVVVAVVMLFVLTGVQSYWNHQFDLEWRQQLHEMSTNPEARPDAWSKTMDDIRTRKICQAILAVSDVTYLLPRVCRRE